MKKVKDMRFEELFQLSETFENLLPQIEDAMEYVKFADYKKILSDESMTKDEIYNRGFTALLRLVEEMKLQLKLGKNANK